MITKIKNILFKQDSLYGGYFYTLAHLLNNYNIINEKEIYKNITLNSYIKNRVLHKFTNQLNRPLTSLDRKVSIPLYSTGFIQKKYKDLFKFNIVSNKDLYKIYITEVYLTPTRKHYILIIKYLLDAENIFVIDSMNDFILSMTSDEFFNYYYPIGYDILSHKFLKTIYSSYEDIKHLIN